MEELLRHYDILIMDAPPVLAVSDSRTLAALADLRFLVVERMLKTEKKQLALTMDALHTVGARVIGTVMNNADVQNEKYYGYGYGYGYGYKYYSYGYGNEHKHRPWWKKLVTKA